MIYSFIMIQVLPGDLVDNEPPYDDVIGLLCPNRLSASEFNINVKNRPY